MSRRILLSLAVAALFTTVVVTPAYGEATLWVSEDTVLTGGHEGNIVVTADYVTLDCDGHAVSGEGFGTGIFLRNRTGVTVRNCVVKNFERGIALWTSVDNVIEGNTANKNSTTGFTVNRGSARNLLVDNKALGGLDGFFLWGWDTDDNELVGNEATNNTRFGFIDSGDSEGNLFVSNKARNNGDTGFSIATNQDRGSTYRDNTAVNNGDVGYFVASFGPLPAHNNVLSGNKATNNDGPGFALYNANDNIFEDNWSNGNDVGFAFWGTAVSNRFTDNRASANDRGGFDIAWAFESLFEGNVADHNAAGFSLQNSDDNVLVGNEASHNTYTGFLVYDWPPVPELSEQSDRNFFDSNTACHNSEWDAKDSTTRETNIWEPTNEFCVTVGI